MSWLYDPYEDERNGKEFKYNLPIFSEDTLLLGFTYRQIMDEVIANYGHNVTEREIRKQVREHLEMVKENMEENLMLCIDNMVKEIRGE
mgnify:FL=1